MSEIGHNSGAIESKELREYVARVERLEADKKDIAEDIKLVLQEAKSKGFDPKIIREVIKIRKISPAAREEHQMLLDTYLAAFGISDED